MSADLRVPNVSSALIGMLRTDCCLQRQDLPFTYNMIYHEPESANIIIILISADLRAGRACIITRGCVCNVFL